MQFPIMLADCAWTYQDKALAGDRGAGCKYPLMTIEDLCTLPVGDLAAKDAVLFLWATYPLLAEGLRVMAAWGFTYKTVAFTWVKRNKHTPGFKMGMGRWTRANAEIVMLGTRGKPHRVNAGVRQIIESVPLRHSAKPPETRDRIVTLMGDLPRVELFARERCAGWHSLGYDIDGADLRDSVPALAQA